MPCVMGAQQNDRFIWLEAVDGTRNIARRYTIATSEDLFGATLVEFAWGRIGTRGQSRVVSFSEHEEAEHFVGQLLRRRASARKRIGVAYRQVPLPAS